MKKEIIGIVTHGGYDWYFESDEDSYSADVVTALDELLGEETSKGDRYKVIIEKLS